MTALGVYAWAAVLVASHQIAEGTSVVGALVLALAWPLLPIVLWLAWSGAADDRPPRRRR